MIFIQNQQGQFIETGDYDNKVREFAEEVIAMLA